MRSIEEQREKIRNLNKLKQEEEKKEKEISFKKFEPKKLQYNNIRFDVFKFFNLVGIYFLYKNNKIVYIGESNCIISRVSQHFKDNTKNFDSFTFREHNGTAKARKQLEKKLIKQYKPKYNKTHNTPKRAKILYRAM